MKLRFAIACFTLVLGFSLIASWARSTDSDSQKQMEFGVEAARKGLWKEAEFRWEKARKLSPGNARILNNLAVAHETQGRMEDADKFYKEALRLLPGNEDIQANYRLFSAIYERYRSRQGQSTEEGDSSHPSSGEDSSPPEP